MQSTPQTVASGQTPISIDWDYLNLAYVKEFPAANWKVTVPVRRRLRRRTTARRSTRSAPHPWAARLWEEFLYSDQGQLLWLKGFSHPVRFQDLAKREGDPGVAARGAAVGEPLREGEVRERRAADRGEGPDRASSGRRRSGRRPSATERSIGGPPAGRQRPAGGACSLAWLGDVPFFAYALAFLFVPAGQRHGRRVQEARRRLDASTTSGCSSTTPYLDAYYRRASRSAGITALARRRRSASLIAYAAIRDGTPRWVRSILTTFSGVAANFGGIPLAFAFIATLGTLGIVTQVPARTSSASTSTRTASRSSRRPGIEIVYLYFQIPLMILVIAPAIDGLRARVA